MGEEGTTRPKRVPRATRDEKAQQIGARIVAARLDQGMKQKELAELLEVAERTMQAYESGESIPWLRLKDLERLLQRPISWFLHGDEETAGRDVQLTEVRSAIENVGVINSGLQQCLSDLLETNREILVVGRDLLEELRRRP